MTPKSNQPVVKICQNWVQVKVGYTSILGCFLHQINQIKNSFGVLRASHSPAAACHILAGSPSCSVDALCAASAGPKGNPRSLGQKIGGVGFMVDLWMIYGEFMMDLWWIYEGFMEDLWTTGDLLWILFRLKSSESSKIFARLKCHFFLLVKSRWLSYHHPWTLVFWTTLQVFTRCLTKNTTSFGWNKPHEHIPPTNLLRLSYLYHTVSIYI